MTTLAEFMIIAGVDNCPPMLEKSMYESWKSRMELYMENRENGRMILNLIQNDLVVHVFTQGDDPIACLKKALAFLSAVAASRFPSTNNQLRNSSNMRNQAIIQEDRGETMHDGRKGLLNAIIIKTEDLDAYDSDCDDVSNAKVVLMANLSNYDYDVISEKAHRIKPTLYDGNVISSQHAVIHVIDDETTLILEEVSRSKMLAKQNDPISKEKKINTTPINFVELNQLSEDFAPRELPKTLKDIFNVFDKDLLDEITKVQTVLNQMEAAVQQCSIDK
ncbi:hypothetical protein Tco_0007376 [Tanacetum coccineum]